MQTPAFDRVAGEGVLFNRAYVPNPKCAPSRAMILTGRNSWQLEEAASHWPYFPQKFWVFPEVLAEHGYPIRGIIREDISTGWVNDSDYEENGLPEQQQ